MNSPQPGQPQPSQILKRVAVGTLMTLVAAILVGCPSSPTAQTPSADQRFLQNERPADAISIAAAVENWGEDEANRTLTLVGRIPDGQNDPFEPKTAQFLMTELPADGHGADDPDHADNCPFCKRRAEQAPKAIVQIVDPESGEVVAQDARQLLGLSNGQRVIASGQATYDSAINIVTLRTSRVFVAP